MRRKTRHSPRALPCPLIRCAAQLRSPISSIYPILAKFICLAASLRGGKGAFFFFVHPNCKLLPRPFVEYPFFLNCTKGVALLHSALCEVHVWLFLYFFMTADTLKKELDPLKRRRTSAKVHANRPSPFCAYPFLQ